MFDDDRARHYGDDVRSLVLLGQVAAQRGVQRGVAASLRYVAPLVLAKLADWANDRPEFAVVKSVL